MTSGDNPLLARLATLLLAGTLIACPVVPGTAAVAAEPEQETAAWGITDLMRSLAQVRKSRARFVERKHMSMLKTPLEFSGELVYDAPGHLEKYTLLPKPESMVLDQDKLVVQNSAGQKRTLSLQDNPAIWAFVESFRSTLAGDLDTLKRFYLVNMAGNARQWQIVLQPLDPKMQAMVSTILISGSADQIGSIEIREAGGDYSIMSIRKDPS